MTSSDLFFNKKKKAIVRREVQQKGGVITKKQKTIYDGQGQSDPEFTKYVADSLGAFTTSNLWSIDKLKEQLDHFFYNLAVAKLFEANKGYFQGESQF
jgi:hypothetical protein